MATPSEVLLMKCLSCERRKPETDFLTYAVGKLAGRRVKVCTTCRLKMATPPIACRACGELRLLADFDKTAEGGKVCKVCLMADPAAYRKICTTCRKESPVSRFSKQSRTAYRQPMCHTCGAKLKAEKDRRAPRHIIAGRRKRDADRLKAAAYDAYGRACVCCGETEPTFLTLDHVNNDGADWRRKVFGRNGGNGAGGATYRWCKHNGYPPIFQVLCWNCQQGKRFNGGICPHQKKTCNDYPAREYGQAAGSASGPAVN